MTSDGTKDTGDDMWLTLHQAARDFDVSLATLHRRRKAGELEGVGAFKDKGQWKIPRQGLARLGFIEIVAPVGTSQRVAHGTYRDTVSKAVSSTPVETPHETTASAEDFKRIQAELNDALRRAEVAEAVSRERDRVIEVQARELARLEASPSRVKPHGSSTDTSPAKSPATLESVAEPTPKRSRWRRWLGA